MKSLKIYFLLCLGFFLYANCHGQNISLNGKWLFKIDPRNKGEREKWHDPRFSISGWDSMPVPGNWQLFTAYEDYSGKAWYRKEFEAPRLDSLQELLLQFEAVFHDSKVWLNGEYLGASNSGFFPFEFEISKKLRARNVLVVMVDNTFRIGAMWNWGGIRRPVNLSIKAKSSVARLFVTSTPDLKNNTAAVSVKAYLYNHEPKQKDVDATMKIFFRGNEIASRNTVLKIPSGDTVQVDYTFNLSPAQTHLWHFDFPNLYDVELALNDRSGKPLDRRTDRFGIRKVEVRGYEMLLNGEAVRLVGFNYVPDDRVSGNTLPAWRYKSDIDMMKSAGANMARFSHLPLPDEVLDYLDEKGIMHYAEIPLWGSDNSMVNKDDPTPKKWLDQLIRRQYNHPAIIGWSVANEIGFNPDALSYVKSAIDYVKENLDTTRLVSDVSCSAAKNQIDAVQYSKIILFNVYGTNWLGGAVSKAHRNHPGKPIFMSEFGDALNEDNPDADNVPIKALMDTLRARHYVIGASLWTFNDYRSRYQSGAVNWSTPASENRPWGIVNVHRQKKKLYEQVRKEFAPVRGFNVSVGKSTVNVIVEPRRKLDLPAYTLRNYYVVFEAYANDNKLAHSEVSALPEIKPGDQSLQLDYKAVTGVTRYRVSLYNPLQYSLLDTTIHFLAPPAPEVKDVQQSNDFVRIYFSKSESTGEVFARYRKNGKWNATKTTISDHVDVPVSPGSAPIEVELVARNAVGESKNNRLVTVESKFGIITPVIYKVGSVENGFMVGYESEKTDYLYQVEYQVLPDSTVFQEQSPSRGVMIVNDIAEGKDVRFRFRKLDQTNAASEWSNYYTVNTGLPKAPQEIRNLQVSKIKTTESTARTHHPERSLAVRTGNGNYWFLSFDPVEFALAYEVRFYDNKGTEVYKEVINTSGINRYVVPSSRTGKATSAKLFALFDSMP